MPPEHDDRVDELREDFRNASVVGRGCIAAYLLIGAFGGLYGGFLLLHETSHWIPWAIALIVVEPIGLACALGLLVLLVPDSPFAVFLTGALRRATVSLVVLGAAVFAFIAGTLCYVAWYFLVEVAARKLAR